MRILYRRGQSLPLIPSLTGQTSPFFSLRILTKSNNGCLCRHASLGDSATGHHGYGSLGLVVNNKL